MSRREQIKLSEEDISAYIRSARTMILVSNGRKGFPHPMPMWFAVDEDDQIVMTTFRKSQKVLNIKKDSKVALLVESGNAYEELKSVLILAEAEIVDELEYTAEVMSRVSIFRGDARADQKDAVRQGSMGQAPKRVVIRFRPVSVMSWDHAKLHGVH
jgi:nitroimidazol reductase NimA-like FMN-containing flavoprotein (pyridoxamine 5'-phosphate oxidase superfamily)|tara:strand:- start:14367 stop:14837 length:471 start_codon:yes stop_codon:yes gene_type:complete